VVTMVAVRVMKKMIRRSGTKKRFSLLFDYVFLLFNYFMIVFKS
jgi:hypothetical protein